MARCGTDVLTKKNSKLEAFLKRNLDPECVERIRATESCIVCSEREDKAFKFVILSDEWVYLTENPPKKIQEAVHLRDVISVDLANDFPDFLSGGERENTQHIVIKYLTDAHIKGQKKRSSQKRNGDLGSSKTPRTPLSARALSARGSLSVSGRRPTISSSRSSFSLSARDFSSKDRKVQFQSGVKTPLLARKTGSGHEANVDALTPKLDAQRTLSVSSDIWREVTGNTDSLSEIQNAKGKKQSVKKNKNLNNNEEANIAGALLNRYSSSNYSHVQNLPRRLPNPSDEGNEHGEHVVKHKTEPSKLGEGSSGGFTLNVNGDGESWDSGSISDEDRPTAAALGIPRLMLPTPNDDSGKDELMLVKPSCSWDLISSLPSNPLFLHPNISGKPRSRSIGSLELRTYSSRSMSGSEGEEDEGEEKEEEMRLREAVLHLYILSYSSPILMLTRCAWNNYILRGTLEEDPEHAIKMCNFSQRGPGTSEKLERLFSELKNELLVAENSVETKFSLVSELKTATQRNFTLKRLFWKAPEVFTYLINQLHLCLPHSKNKVMAMGDSEEAKQARADEFDLAIEILGTIGLMLRETEILPSRLRTLKASKGKAMLDLICLLTCSPEVPQKHAPLSTKAQQLLGSSQNDQWQCTADIELSKLLVELTTVSASVLYELVLIAHQANWGDTKGSFLNITWMVKLLEGLNSTEKFVESVVGQVLKLVSPSRSGELSPYEMVLVHQQFSLLQTFLEYSPHLANYIRHNFSEEFKYYIQPPIIERKFTQRYLLQPHTLRLIQEVVSSVLHRKITFRPKHQNTSV